MRVKYNVDTQLVFQIGDPLDHSTAALVHNKMYELANLNAVCLPMEVPGDGLGAFVQAAKTLRINGFDITMPHKTAIIEYLDDCDESSRVFKSVNHVRLENGRLVGIGLDGVGMGLALEEKLGAGALAGRRALLIGAGSVCGPIAADLCGRGVREFVVANRTIEKAQAVAKALVGMFPRVKAEVCALTPAALEACAPKVELAIQCTSLGMDGSKADFESLDFVSKFPAGCFAADVLYPTSSFLRAAAARGLETLSGKGMLLHQQLAMMAFRFGVEVPAALLGEVEEVIDIAVAMRAHRNRILAQRQTP